MPQVLANALVEAGMLLVVGFGFALIYRVGGFFHFAHAAVFTAGAYINLALLRTGYVPLALSVPASLVGCALLGALMEAGVYRRLRRRGGSPSVLLLSSLGLYVSLTAVIAMLFGSQAETVPVRRAAACISVYGANLTLMQNVIAACGTVTVCVGAAALALTAPGRAVRAVASDPWLARVVGVDTDRVTMGVFAAGSALAGLGGILFSLDLHLRPTMGLQVLMLAVVAVLLGGRGSPGGLAMAAVTLAICRNLGGWYLGSQWQDTIAFLILLGCLLARPRGFLGRPLKTAGV